MKRYSLYLLSCLVLFVACKDDDSAHDDTVHATAAIYSLTTGSGPAQQVGEAHISAKDGLVTLSLSVSGMPPDGQHAVHLHEGSCQNPGAHWNGGESMLFCDAPSQGSVWGKPFLGDVGNLEVGPDGSGTLTLTTELWALGDGSPRDIAGTFLTLHAGPDDYQMACHYHNMPPNAKIGCGEVVLRE